MTQAYINRYEYLFHLFFEQQNRLKTGKEQAEQTMEILAGHLAHYNFHSPTVLIQKNCIVVEAYNRKRAFTLIKPITDQTDTVYLGNIKNPVQLHLILKELDNE